MTETTQFPQGAEALLVALATPAPNGLSGIPVLLWGRPGVGKSSFIESLAGEALTVTTLIASIHDPTDFSGLPILDGESVRYASPSWVNDFSEQRAGILFLDELSTAPPSVQSALLRVVFERKVGNHTLPAGVRIVAAANPPDMMVGGWELSPPLRNRFVHLDWDIGPELFIDAQSAGWRRGNLPDVDTDEHATASIRWKAIIAGYLRLNPDGLYASPEDNPYGFASPRSWDFVAALLASCDLLRYALEEDATSAVPYQLVKGCLGEATALTFLEYAGNLSLPDPEAVLGGERSVILEEFNDSEVYVLFAGLNTYLLHNLETPRLLDYGQRYLDLARRAFAGGRRDVIFVALKQLARRGFLLKMNEAAAAPGVAADRRGAATAAIRELFSDPTLQQFVSVLG